MHVDPGSGLFLLLAVCPVLLLTTVGVESKPPAAVGEESTLEVLPPGEINSALPTLDPSSPISSCCNPASSAHSSKMAMK